MIPLFDLPDHLTHQQFNRLPQYVRAHINGLRRAYAQADDALRAAHHRHAAALTLADDQDTLAHARRPAQELPTEDGAVIVPADGREFITMTDAEGWAFGRMTYSAEHDRWYGMTTRGAIAMFSAEQITPGTWKIEER